MNNELISRQAAINAIDECYCGGEDSCGEPWIYKENAVEAIQMIEPIPPAEPQIIRCKDCKHLVREDRDEYTPYGFYNTYFDAFCDKHWDKEQGEYLDVNLDDYCSLAERRQDG